jgi:hypothetical protein
MAGLTDRKWVTTTVRPSQRPRRAGLSCNANDGPLNHAGRKPRGGTGPTQLGRVPRATWIASTPDERRHDRAPAQRPAAKRTMGFAPGGGSRGGGFRGGVGQLSPLSRPGRQQWRRGLHDPLHPQLSALGNSHRVDRMDHGADRFPLSPEQQPGHLLCAVAAGTREKHGRAGPDDPGGHLHLLRDARGLVSGLLHRVRPRWLSRTVRHRDRRRCRPFGRGEPGHRRVRRPLRQPVRAESARGAVRGQPDHLGAARLFRGQLRDHLQRGDQGHRALLQVRHASLDRVCGADPACGC